jgi:uncharacterized protein
MNRLISALLFLLALDGAAQAATNPCSNVTGWRAAACDFSRTKLVHAAWGYEHSLRDYTLATVLAQADHVAVDDEVVFAAAMLHDMGGFAPFETAGVDHAARSAALAPEVLASFGFPAAKAVAVRAAIIHHSYYDPQRPETPEGLVLHDADGIDFLGAVAAMRILAIAGREPGIGDTAAALGLLKSLARDVPGKIYGGPATQAIAAERAQELTTFLSAVERESFGFGIPGGAP